MRQGKDYSEKKLLSIQYSFLPLSLAIRKGTYQFFFENFSSGNIYHTISTSLTSLYYFFEELPFTWYFQQDYLKFFLHIFLTYNYHSEMSRSPRPGFFIYLSIHLSSPFLSLSSFISFSLLSHLSLPTCSPPFPCRPQRRLTYRFQQGGAVWPSPPCLRVPKVLASSVPPFFVSRARFHPIPRSLPLSSNCQLLLVSKSMGRVLPLGRACENNKSPRA